MKTIKWGILGLGKIAGKFVTGLKDVEGAELYAVASRSKSKAEAFAKEYNATKFFSSYEAMLKDEALDVVYIATPHVFHHQQTLLCLDHKKAVLCEKPFAINKEQVEEMIAKAKKENVFLMEAMWTQFLPHFEFVLDLIESEKYGKIKNLKADFGFPAPVDLDKRLYNKDLGGGSLLDIGIYPIFMAMSALGTPEKIHASAKFSETGIDTECDMIFEYTNGVEAELGSSIVRQTPTAAIIQFEKATITLNTRFHEPTSVKIQTPESEETKEFKVNSNGYNFEAKHVQKMLLEGKTESTEMTFAKSLQLIELLDKVRDQIGLEY
ncbi:Gfo/Idh/MocA family protein [Salegentibacter mishustinae]|uniref:Oxidoreductase n=1 Tax=Salegentibacter mishustinae TaxID=270918 RepID=A0A0Q9ZAZ4_9FLAO|nr:Gfo/Idh/MocA family oxidoreductase [Salegentibacter mishustinae]KRG29305.1 oxidoreductase [Salegentibacter mishustinae]PNW21648.1 oxidoreductase [Salegentibacter mishustinae]PZX64981.1 putative dehydrogenase [Salegentibacter mishustinae]GGW88083.1 dehydrogenase [Salegentibacter mishustinae]